MTRATPARGRASGTAPDWAISADDVFLFNEGTHYRLFDKLGAHPLADGGFAFAVWAPNARSVSVIGDFNGGDRRAPSDVVARGLAGIWWARETERRKSAADSRVTIRQ